MILLVLNCLSNCPWAQTRDSLPSTGEVVQADTAVIAIPIKYIKAANAKLIERLYLKESILKKDSIIDFKDSYINEQSIIIKDFQNKVLDSNKINLNLQKDIVKKDRKLLTWKCISITAIVTTGIVLLTK